MIKSYKDHEVHQKSYELAMEIFWLTRNIPKEEIYSLTSQVARSSRSVSANIAEGWAKGEYESSFKNHLIHSLGSSAETENWLMFARDCKYLTDDQFEQLKIKNESIGKMLARLHQNRKSY